MKHLLYGLLPLALFAADNTIIEQGNVLQNAVNPAEQREIRSADRFAHPEKADITSFARVPEGFRFTVTAPCRAMILLADASGKIIAGLHAGELEQGHYTLRYHPALTPGRYRVDFLLGPRMVSDTSFPPRQFEKPGNIRVTPRGKVYVGEGKSIREVTPSGNSLFKANHFLADVDAEGNVYGFDGAQCVRKFAPDGKLLAQLKCSPNIGFSCGAPGVYFSRERSGHQLMVSDKGNFVKQQANGFLAPIHGRYIGPALAADGRGNVYTSDCFSNGAYKGAVAKFHWKDGRLTRSGHCGKAFRDIIGLTVSGNFIYAIERGTIAPANRKHWRADSVTRLVQIIDNGAGLDWAQSWKLPGVQGGRAVATDASGTLFYVLEDAEDFRHGTEFSLKGRGRLWRFRLDAARKKQIEFTERRN